MMHYPIVNKNIRPLSLLLSCYTWASFYVFSCKIILVWNNCCSFEKILVFLCKVIQSHLSVYQHLYCTNYFIISFFDAHLHFKQKVEIHNEEKNIHDKQHKRWIILSQRRWRLAYKIEFKNYSASINFNLLVDK